MNKLPLSKYSMLLKIIELWFKFITQSDILKKINDWPEIYKIQEREEERKEIRNNTLSKVGEW